MPLEVAGWVAAVSERHRCPEPGAEVSEVEVAIAVEADIAVEDSDSHSSFQSSVSAAVDCSVSSS